MYGSRRFWTTATVGVLLAGVAVLLDRPEPIVGAAGVAAWLLATQLVAVRAFEQATDLDITYKTQLRRAAVDQPVGCRFVVERSAPGSTTVEATAPIPLAARGATRADRTVTLAPGDTRASTTFELLFPVAGRFEFDAPKMELTDAFGLFTERLELGEGPHVSVNAEGPRDIHVGQGGERIIAAFGEHATDQRGAGLQPEELRQYVAGDPADSIDWKATARLNEPYVREYQAETDRETLIVVDHRDAMDHGPGGETMLAYAREVAIAVAESAASASDPLGLYAVGDAGLTARHPPSTAPSAYTTIRSRLQALEATEATTASSPATEPSRAHRAVQTLRGDDSAFANQLTPFLDAGDAYVRRLSGDPLFGTVQELVTDADSNQWTVIVTHDGDPARLREAAKLAASRSAAVLVFVTPTVLFDADRDLDAAYDRYVAFEDLRRDLDRIPRVTAFEVGPGDRVQRLLAQRRTRTTGT
ncbi:DUF58 domain-containing protein [Halorarius litoreus]|uniref:DUF58 domain-containing protein n=1 Tax=Halorarius litoreus TaxID=2962676 RepID=UPI0020CBA686|nr:DUF58 domain-containing protein [Halorarius litoreus]